MATNQSHIGHVVVGNPENRRVQFFQSALKRHGLPQALEVSYEELLKYNLQQPADRASHPFVTALAQGRARFPQVFVRLESAGESFSVERGMIAFGTKALSTDAGCQTISARGACRLREDYGRLRYLRQHFAGYERLLLQLQSLMGCEGTVRTYNSVAAILLACDKQKCSQALRSIGVSVAASLRPVSSFDELYSQMMDAGWKRAFVKHIHGSSAAGVIALDASGGKLRATTTMEMTGSGSRTQFHNNLKLRVYHRSGEISKLVNFLCREGVHVEQWLPRASVGGRVFDLRIVVINGRSCHVVVRTSRGPITNLHLGNRRGDVATLQGAMGVSAWDRAMRVAEQAAAVLPTSKYVGVDLLLQPGYRLPTVIELNAFGDLLPGVLHQGMSTYEAEVACAIGDRFEST